MTSEPKLGTLSTLSIGLGGMVGGGIFAVTGLTVQVTRGGAPVAFLIAGIVALLTSYFLPPAHAALPRRGRHGRFPQPRVRSAAASSRARRTSCCCSATWCWFPSTPTPSAATARDSLPRQHRGFWTHALTSGVILVLVVVNAFGGSLVVRSENLFNAVKMILLGAFIVVGLLTPMDWSRLSPEHHVTPMAMISGAMLIFLNYEGFELIANASKDVANPKRSLPIAYIGGVLMVIAIYMLITTVVVGHLGFAEVAANSDNVLAATAMQFMGKAGFITIAIAALLATTSAINATFYSTGRLAFIIAQSGELPPRFRTRLSRPAPGRHRWSPPSSPWSSRISSRWTRSPPWVAPDFCSSSWP